MHITTQIYLDANATSPVLPSAVAAATSVMGAQYGNPSSTHSSGIQAKSLLDSVRQTAARRLGVGSGKLMFNSGATEGIQTAILSALVALRERRDAGEHIGQLLVYGATEHKAVPESLSHWNRVLGLHLAVEALMVTQDGMHDLMQLRTLAPKAALVCTMAANNETGVISDLVGIEAVLAETGSTAYWLVDCVQALGKLDLNLANTRIDYAPFSGHKLYAPKGIGMLYIRQGAPFTPLMVGGGQESGLRAGTENMAGIAALGEVLLALENETTFRTNAELYSFREQIAETLRCAFPGLVFNAPFATSLPTTLNFSVPGLPSAQLLDVFDAAQVRVSSGSACSAARAAPSYVLEAMGVPAWQASAAIRLSFGPLTSAAEVIAACARIAHCAEAIYAKRAMPISVSHLAAQLPDSAPVRFNEGGVTTWLVADWGNANCIVIDPHPLTDDRAGHYIGCQGLNRIATLYTDRSCQPQNSLPLIALGNSLISAALHGAHNVIYFLTNKGAPERARFAFIGRVKPVDCAFGADTLLCPGEDQDGTICTTHHAAHRTGHDLRGLAIDADQLAQFMLRHPGARLIDVREHAEQAAGRARTSISPWALGVPLSELPGKLETWLGTPRQPLVFFCRTGNRSARAAACLRRLGHQAAWTISGGMALAGTAIAAQEQAA